MIQFLHTPVLLSADSAEVASNSGAVGRVVIVLLLVFVLTLAVRSLRLIWGPISEIVALLLRAGAVAALAFIMLIVVVVLTLGLV